MKKNERRAFIGRGLFALATGLGLREASAAATSSGQTGMRKLRGDVRVNGIAAKLGTLVRAGDTVATGPDSEAIYVMGNDAFLQRANSTVHFGDNVATDFLRVVTGALLSVFGHGAKRLAAQYVTIGIRGTGCYIEEGRQGTFFCLCYGKADVHTAAGGTMAYETRHHDRPTMIDATSARPAAPVTNHTDAELVMLESYVGRKPPFYGGKGSAER